VEASLEDRWQSPRKEVLSGAFFWLTAFYFIYCARPTDFTPGLNEIPLAKITAVLAMLSLIFSAGKTPRKLANLPREGYYLLILVALLFGSAALSPVWRGGAVFATLDFAKVSIAWLLTFLLVTSFKRLRRMIFIQAASVALVSVVAVVKGHGVPRLSGVIGGFYSNPNDMAFAIVLSLPFCLAFLLSARGMLRKGMWFLGMLMMAMALILTASRAGFIDLLIAGTFCLWHFGVRGKRLYLIGGTFILGAVLLIVAGRSLMRRFAAISGSDANSQLEMSAEGSYEERKILMMRALDAIVHYPVLGVGVSNFVVYSGLWKEVHASYLQIGAEGGIPALILYLMFFARGFGNLKDLGRGEKLDPETTLFAGAFKSSLVGFIVGACFAPEAYQFFPYLTVCFTSVLLAMKRERVTSEALSMKFSAISRRGFAAVHARQRRSGPLNATL
jgi:O-antigen ligase